jgi:CMP-N-acetylneuraminic acid synthetase
MAIAIIPARGGSKGIPHKNLVLINGRQLLSYSIEACLACEEITRVLVSTDSGSIRDFVANQYRDRVTVVQRPASISGDESVSEEALLHAIIENRNYDLDDRALFVQATSIFTESSDLTALLKLLENNNSAAFYVEDYGFFFELDDLRTVRTPRQLRLPRLRECGNAWAFKVGGFLEHRSRLFGSIGLVQIERFKAHEIDTLYDLRIAELIMTLRHNC